MKSTWKSPCVIFDLDGTLCNCEHRLHYIKQTPKDWDNFHDACVNDLPNPEVVELFQVLSKSQGLFGVICSGRPDSHRGRTGGWLADHGLSYSYLLMRPTGDYRPDTVVKAEMLEKIRGGLGLKPVMAVDDRPDIVKLWRAAGIPTLEILSSNWER